MSPGVRQGFIAPSKRRRKYEVELKAGIQLGYWLLLRPEREKGPSKRWFCRCTLCDTEMLVNGYNLKTGKTKHCRKCNPGRNPRAARVTMGQKSHFWTVIDPHVRRKFSKRNWHRVIQVQCVCGLKKYILEKTLLTAKSKSCGCMRGYFSSLNNRGKHGVVQDGLQEGAGHSGLPTGPHSGE